MKAIVDPYQTIITAYNNTEIGKTTAPIDTLKAFTEETNGANLQADASVWELRGNGIEGRLPPVGRDDQQQDRGHGDARCSPSR